MRRFLIAANWKMNPAPAGAFDSGSAFQSLGACDVVVFPSYIDIQKALDAGFIVGAQCGHAKDCGACTGDVSMKMLSEAGCTYVLCGHSERRRSHHETNEDVAEQVVAALEAGLHPIVCVGEGDNEHDSKKKRSVIEAQLKGIPLGSDITIAYEPVWAIGTGVTATPEEAEEMHAFIRSLLPEDRQEKTRILYGGSMNALNAHLLLEQPNIDGGLVGGASLKPNEFKEIIDSALEIEEK